MSSSTSLACLPPTFVCPPGYMPAIQTQTLAQALAPRIRVTAIAPGPTLPNIRQAQEDFTAQVAALPLGRGPALEEFVAAVAFILEAGSLTGQMIALDGGQHLAWQTPDVMGVE